MVTTEAIDFLLKCSLLFLHLWILFRQRLSQVWCALPLICHGQKLPTR
jgi:hypothetical protein